MKEKMCWMFWMAALLCASCTGSAQVSDAAASKQDQSGAPKAASLPAAPLPKAEPPRPVILATTTSTQDTGLLDALLPIFEKQSGLTVKTVAVGTGQALEMGRRGEADVLLVHAPDKEQEFVASGKGKNRRPVMHNDFVVVGPASDPAKLSKTKDVVAAFQAIAAKKATFVSRGDKSGTHTKELALWKQAGIEPKGDWYLESGQGMGATLQIASEKRAYTLADRGTFTATANLELKIEWEGDPSLLNPYHTIEVVADKVNANGAKQLADFFVSQPAQQAIAAFEKKGLKLFVADALQGITVTAP